MKKSIILICLFLLPCFASASTIYCFAMQRTGTDAPPVIRKAVELTPAHHGPLTIGVVGGVTYQLTLDPWNQLSLYISGNGLRPTMASGSANSEVSVTLFTDNTKVLSSLVCSANISATPYRIMRCPQVTADCKNN